MTKMRLLPIHLRQVTTAEEEREKVVIFDETGRSTNVVKLITSDVALRLGKVRLPRALKSVAIPSRT
jgi:hypothetical protein